MSIIPSTKNPESAKSFFDAQDCTKDPGTKHTRNQEIYLKKTRTG
jgi:hypothetical protein